MAVRIIEPRVWAEQPRTAASPILLDILSPEHYAAIHLPHAINACVYEVGFIDKVAQHVPDKNTEIVIYDANSTAHAARWAAGKLQSNGYAHVTEIAGGLQAWLAQGLPVEPAGATLPADPKITDRKYHLDCTQSVLRWTGRNINGTHNGTIPFLNGHLTIEQGALTHGYLVVDMTRIADLDLQGTDLAAVLVSHLLSDDFFDVARYPTAEAKLRGSLPIPASSAGSPNLLVDAELTIKGISHPVEFPAIIMQEKDGIKMQTAFEIDRTKWNVIYGSGKFFKGLGSHLVNDTISIELFLHAV